MFDLNRLDYGFSYEVKRNLHLSPEGIRGLAAFQEEYPEAKCLILTMSKQRENYRGFPVIPIEEFLLQLSSQNRIH